MNHKKLIIIPLNIILVIALIMSIPNNTFLKFAWCSDALGNDFVSVEIWQYNGTDWILRGNLTVSENAVKVHDSQNTTFTVQVKLNDTLAVNEAEAEDYTKIYMNITHEDTSTIWVNEPLNFTSISHSGNFYYLFYEGVWITDIPEMGVDYTCELDYQQYY